VALRYTYGVGDKVTASFVSRESVVVTLHIERAPGPAPAIALFGELRFQSNGGSDKLFEYEDGTVLHCTEARSLTTP